mgnify:FL=1
MKTLLVRIIKWICKFPAFISSKENPESYRQERKCNDAETNQRQDR